MLNADEIYEKVTTAGDDFADKKAAYEALDDLTKTVLAEITSGFLPPVCSSKAEAEIRATSSGQYKEHLAAKSQARKSWLLAEVKYKGLIMLAELRRTQESTRRQEMRI